MNHAEYQKICKTRTSESLRYIIKDCQETIEANPEGSKVGYYLDEISYCAMELKRRETK